MTIAFVLLNIEYGGEESVVTQLKVIPNVKRTVCTQGQYDIMITLNESNTKNIQNIIASKIRKIKEVRSILCLIVADKPAAKIWLSSHNFLSAKDVMP